MNITEELVQISVGTVNIEGSLNIPANAKGLVLFAHGSGSSRHSPRNQFVAQVLLRKQFGTLLMDLLTPKEDETYATRFDINLLTRRLIASTEWVQQQPRTRSLPVGYFGASTGAAAALKAAAGLGTAVKAVVSRGGRPDLAGADLSRVKAPVLLIVGGQDFGVIELNEESFTQLPGTKELIKIPGATHLFEEPGTLEQAARLAGEWFEKHLLGEN